MVLTSTIALDGIIGYRGIGTCGTYAVKVEGEVSAVNSREQTRRSLPPHSPTIGLGLACETLVLGDVKITKFYGLWGQGSQLV
jgi:ferredoxin